MKLSDIKSQGIKVNYVVGTITRTESTRFKRMIFRITKGNVYIEIQEIEKFE